MLKTNKKKEENCCEMYVLSFCRENIGAFFKTIGNIEDFYENITEFHQFQKKGGIGCFIGIIGKYRRSCQA